MENKINPVLIDIEPMFRFGEGQEWAVQYNVLIGDKLNREFSLKKMRTVPTQLGYHFWFLVRSPGFLTTSDDIDTDDVQKALVMNDEDTKTVLDYLSKKIQAIGIVPWEEFEAKAGEFLDVSDIQDDSADT